MIAQEELIRWDWIVDHLDEIPKWLIQHLQLTILAVVIGFAISFPIAVYAYRHRKVYPPVTWVTGLLYTIPSLALFAVLVPYTGLGFVTAEIGLVSYTLLILIRNTVAGLSSVPADVKEAAAGMGLSKRQILTKVELPLALPVIMTGVRIATVTTFGLVTVTALIGMGGLGHFILEGFRRLFTTEMLLGAGLSILLAIVVDALLLLGQRLLTPWARKQTGRAAA